jgi:hypothetical protein
MQVDISFKCLYKKQLETNKDYFGKISNPWK